MTTVRLYLDFDGVLHPWTDKTPKKAILCLDGNPFIWHEHYFAFSELLANLLEPFPEVEIYVHSTWRYMWEETRPPDFEWMLGPLYPRFIRTIHHSVKGKRCAVILQDMANDAYKGPWIAVDDQDEDFTQFRNTHGNFVHTHSQLGISCPKKQAELIRKIKNLIKGSN